jgi:hypothetical protein
MSEESGSNHLNPIAIDEDLGIFDRGPAVARDDDRTVGQQSPHRSACDLRVPIGVGG